MKTRMRPGRRAGAVLLGLFGPLSVPAGDASAAEQLRYFAATQSLNLAAAESLICQEYFGRALVPRVRQLRSELILRSGLPDPREAIESAEREVKGLYSAGLDALQAAGKQLAEYCSAAQACIEEIVTQVDGSVYGWR